jgi:hypothetical protein
MKKLAESLMEPENLARREEPWVLLALRMALEPPADSSVVDNGAVNSSVR